MYLERNENNHFRNYPRLKRPRSRFTIPSRHKTTFDSGELIPIYWSEVLPGDSATMDIGAAIRMTTPIFPVMDTAFIDLYRFYCPNRILWEHYEEFFGANKKGHWTPTTEYTIPQIKAPSGGWGEGTLADYFGLPTKVAGITTTHLPFRAYAKIYNEWFRNINTLDPAYINEDETTLTGVNTISDYVTDLQLGGGPAKVARFHDYFTSALPEPSRGELVGIGGQIPVYPMQNMAIPINDFKLGTNDWPAPLIWGNYSKNSTTGKYELKVPSSGRGLYTNGIINLAEGSTNNFEGINKSLNDVTGSTGTMLFDLSETNGEVTTTKVIPLNLGADANYLTINDFFQAYAIQNLLWRDGVGGSRYRSLILSHWGVQIADKTVQVPEYLGGDRLKINVDQVVQTSSTDATSPQGNTSAYSLTSTSGKVFTKSFEESGIIMILACVRNVETYQQGIERYWTKKSRFDFYWPELSNIAEQPIFNREIYAQGTDVDNEVFGYQEAWADYKYKPSTVSGAFRSNYNGTLDSWHYANWFTELPTLEGLNNATSQNIQRTLAVENEPQFIADFAFHTTWTRRMPIYSVPGLRSFM